MINTKIEWQCDLCGSVAVTPSDPPRDWSHLSMAVELVICPDHDDAPWRQIRERLAGL